jgi:hypothetical protein
VDKIHELKILTQMVHVVTSVLFNVDSDEELRPSAKTWTFRAPVTIIISTDGVHKELLWFPSLKRKNVYIISPHPTPTLSALQPLSQSYSINPLACFMSVASQ